MDKVSVASLLAWFYLGILQLQSLMDKVSVASLFSWLYLVYYSYKVSWTRYLWPIFLHDFIWYATVTKPHGQGICCPSFCMALSGVLQLQSLMDKVSVVSLLHGFPMTVKFHEQHSYSYYTVLSMAA